MNIPELIGAVFFFIVGATLIAYAIFLYKRPTQLESSDAVPIAIDDLLTSEHCDKGELIECEIHRLVDTGGGSSEIASIGGAGSGTAMIAYFCAKHCPGGCDQRHKAWWQLWG